MRLTIAVTGGAGRIGRPVLQAALDEGHTVVSIDLKFKEDRIAHERLTYKEVDLMDYDAFETAVKGCDALIHLAGIFNLKDENGEKLDTVMQHHLHNVNTSMSYNALNIAWMNGIDRVVLASSVHVIGLTGTPRFDYLPIDEDHPLSHMDAYSVSKYIVEVQSASFVRRNPNMRIATLRFHDVISDEECTPQLLHSRGGRWRELWGWVSATSAAQAALLGLTAPYQTFPRGTHETFFVAASTTQLQQDSLELLRSRYPDIQDLRRDFRGTNGGFFSSEKAESMLGWKGEHCSSWQPAAS